jgi:hypothetical protein
MKTWHAHLQDELGPFAPATLAALASLPAEVVISLDYKARLIAVEYAQPWAGAGLPAVDAVIALLRRAEAGEIVPASEWIAASDAASDAAWTAASDAAVGAAVGAAWTAARDAASDAARDEIKARIEAAIIEAALHRSGDHRQSGDDHE